jgi:uncharacterized protein YqfB (UPF0267 family)
LGTIGSVPSAYGKISERRYWEKRWKKMTEWTVAPMGKVTDDGKIPKVSDGTVHEYKFAEPLVAPILNGAKTATVRYRDERDVRRGDFIRAKTAKTETPFALLEVKATASVPIISTLEVIEMLGFKHGADDPDELLKKIQKHYDVHGLSMSTPVQAICFEGLELKEVGTT